MTASTDLRRVRSRTLPGPVYKMEGTARAVLFGTPQPPVPYGGQVVEGHEITEDATHPMFLISQRKENREAFRRLHMNPFFRLAQTGGPFTSHKVIYDEVGRKVGGTVKINQFSEQSYSGWIGPANPRVAESFVPSGPDDSFLMNLGAEAIKNSAPGEPMAELSQLLVELKREGLPSAPLLNQMRNKSLTGTGSEYLNYEFGWAPIIREVYNLADNLDKTEKAWRDYVKRANVLQRRHIEYPSQTTFKTETINSAIAGTVYPYNLSPIVTNGSSPLIRERTEVITRRFSAAFQYAVPDRPNGTRVDEFVRKTLELKLKYGLDVSPALIWELTPWSWLIDWILPVGNFISAVSDQFLGNMAMPWAYISEHREVTDVYTRPAATVFGGSVGRLVVKHDYKRRIPASPFGFGISWEGLSPKQLAILAAIGITR